MKKFLISGLACVGAILAVPDTAYAHGGQYRGPGDVVPPNPGGGGGRTPGPSGPSTPGPSGPGTPGPSGPATGGPAGPGTGGPAGPAAASGPTTGQGGMPLGDDLTRWQFWWEFNKDPFINLRAAVHATGEVSHSDDFFMGSGRVAEAKDTMKPTEAQILSEVLPSLKRALDATDQRDIVSSCMVALAKIGKNGDNIQILPIFKERLKSSDQEIRETAAVSMGISQMTDAVEDLINLVADNAAGRKLVDRGDVDDRTRSFAAYGLGLIAYATSNNDVKATIAKALQDILALEDLPGRRNIKTAAINGLSLLNADPTDAKGRELILAALDSLEKYYTESLGVGEQLIQANVPPAIAKLLQDAEDAELLKAKSKYQQMFLDELNGKSKRKSVQNQIFQSAAIALGQMTAPFDDKRTTPKLDQEVSTSLLKYYQKGKDLQATYFSLLALGQIGGLENRAELIKALQSGSKALQKPWAAIALGVYAYNQNEAGEPVDQTIGDQLQGWLSKLKNPETQAAIAIGLGLAKYTDAADELRDMLIKEKHKDELAGYLSIGLALMDDSRSIQLIKEIAEDSVRRPSRLQQCSIALGKLGDKSVAEMLTKMLTEDGEVNLAKMSAIASALGFIGDRRTIGPLKKMLFNEDLTDLSRAFAAVALGGVADKELLPWNSKIAVNMNYRAAVETLTNQVSGILDIL